jgi:hypothetical protein
VAVRAAAAEGGAKKTTMRKTCDEGRHAAQYYAHEKTRPETRAVNAQLSNINTQLSVLSYASVVDLHRLNARSAAVHGTGRRVCQCRRGRRALGCPRLRLQCQWLPCGCAARVDDAPFFFFEKSLPCDHIRRISALPVTRHAHSPVARHTAQDK